MVDGVVGNAKTSLVEGQLSDPLELLDEPSAPLLSPLDARALSAAKVYETSWDDYARSKAKAIYDETLWIRGLFGALDGLIISYSTFKYVFDFISPANVASADAMHDWMVTGSGALSVCTGSLAIITLSLVGNLFDDNHKNSLLRSMTAIWPYVRDGFKGLKFAYKGVRSTIQVAQLMGVDLRSMIFPLGLVLGVAAAANRIWYRSQVTEKRKEQQKINNVLLSRAQNLGMDDRYELHDGAGMSDNTLTLKPKTLYLQLNDEGVLEYRVIDPAGQLAKGKLSLERDVYGHEVGEEESRDLAHLMNRYRDQILAATCHNGHTATPNTASNREAIRDLIKDGSSFPQRGVVVASALFGGFVDGLYTYMGAMGLAILSPQLFAAMAVCCLVFTVICVMNRYYEEDQYQNEFLRSKLNVELVLAAKEIEDSFSQMQKLSKRKAKIFEIANSHRADGLKETPERQEDEKIDVEINSLDELLNLQQEIFKKLKTQYDELYEVSTGRAILMGLRTGLYCYSAVSSLMLAYAAFCTTFPPALLVTAVAIGILSLIGFAIHAVIVNNSQHPEKVNLDEGEPRKNLKLGLYVHRIKETLITGRKIESVPHDERDALMDGMPMGPMPQIDYQPALEIVRSCCSGLPKGNKGVDFVGECWLEPDSQGHYQETPWMSQVGVVFSLFYAVVYALRAFGKGCRGANDVPVAKLHIRPDFDEGDSFPSSPVNTPLNVSIEPSPSLLSSMVYTLNASTDSVTTDFHTEPASQLPSSPSVEDMSRASPSSMSGWPGFFGAMGGNSSAVDLASSSHQPS